MTGAILASWPDGAVPGKRFADRLMDIILHLGAHRTGTTTFQHYLRDQGAFLEERGVVLWGPHHCRDHVFPGLFRNVARQKGRNIARRAEGRARMLAAQASVKGAAHLLVSDENLLGTCIQNLRAGRLYPAAGERAARIAAAFGQSLNRIVLSIRSQELYWASAAALTVSRGHPVPTPAQLDAIARSRRGWRDVITDLACAVPTAQIRVLPFEVHGGRPDALLAAALDLAPPPDTEARWLNRSLDQRGLRSLLREQGADPEQVPEGTGRWQPFNDAQIADLRETYSDDLHWLTAGADGLAELTETWRDTRAGSNLPRRAAEKGQGHDKGQLA